MKLYELTYFLSSKLTEKDLADFSDKLSSFIQENEGLSTKSNQAQEKLAKRKLGSAIKKEGQAYFGVLNFYFDPKKVENLKTKLSSDNQVLRYIILAKEEPKKSKISKSLSRIPRIEKRPKPLSEKVDLHEIEKKLEEILEE